MARITIKLWGDCSPEEKAALESLTLYGSSQMKDDIIRQTENFHRIHCFIARDKGQIVGWSAAIPATAPRDFVMRGNPEYTNVYIFVDQLFRRCGIGSQILGRVKKWLKKHNAIGRVFNWSTPSAAFYNKVAKGDYFTIKRV